MEKNKQAKKLGGCTGKGFKPGISGNPGGRKKTKNLDKILYECLNANEIKSTIWIKVGRKVKQRTTTIRVKETILQELIHILIAKALQGDIKALQEIFDRYVGKPPIGVTVQDDNKGALISAIEKMIELSPDK